MLRSWVLSSQNAATCSPESVVPFQRVAVRERWRQSSNPIVVARHRTSQQQLPRTLGSVISASSNEMLVHASSRACRGFAGCRLESTDEELERMSRGLPGWQSIACCGIGAVKWGGLLNSSRGSASVTDDPAARTPPVKTCLALDNSSSPTLLCAIRCLRCLSSPLSLCSSPWMFAVSNNTSHTPRLKRSMRCSSSRLPTLPRDEALDKRRAGSNPENFQAHSLAISSKNCVALWMASRAIRYACLYRPRMNPGNDPLRNSARRSTSSGASHAAACGSAGKRSSCLRRRFSGCRVMRGRLSSCKSVGIARSCALAATAKTTRRGRAASTRPGTDASPIPPRDISRSAWARTNGLGKIRISLLVLCLRVGSRRTVVSNAGG